RFKRRSRGTDSALFPEHDQIPRNSPILSINATIDESPERTVFPFPRDPGMAVLHRVVVDVIEMPFQVVLVADQMLPESLLPQGSRYAVLSCHVVFDQADAQGVIAVLLGQAPQEMAVVG